MIPNTSHVPPTGVDTQFMPPAYPLRKITALNILWTRLRKDDRRREFGSILAARGPQVLGVIKSTQVPAQEPAPQKLIYCESGRIGPYFPDFSANRTTMHLQIEKIWPRFPTFSLRSLPRRLLACEFGHSRAAVEFRDGPDDSLALGLRVREPDGIFKFVIGQL